LLNFPTDRSTIREFPVSHQFFNGLPRHQLLIRLFLEEYLPDDYRVPANSPGFWILAGQRFMPLMFPVSRSSERSANGSDHSRSPGYITG